MNLVKVFVSKHAYLKEREWLRVGWKIWEQLRFEASLERRDFLLPLPRSSGGWLATHPPALCPRHWLGDWLVEKEQVRRCSWNLVCMQPGRALGACDASRMGQSRWHRRGDLQEIGAMDPDGGPIL